MGGETLQVNQKSNLEVAKQPASRTSLFFRKMWQPALKYGTIAAFSIFVPLAASNVASSYEIFPKPLVENTNTGGEKLIAQNNKKQNKQSVDNHFYEETKKKNEPGTLAKILGVVGVVVLYAFLIIPAAFVVIGPFYLLFRYLAPGIVKELPGVVKEIPSALVDIVKQPKNPPLTEAEEQRIIKDNTDRVIRPPPGDYRGS